MSWENLLKEKDEYVPDDRYNIRMPNACPRCNGDLVSEGWDRWSYTCQKCGRSYMIDGEL